MSYEYDEIKKIPISVFSYYTYKYNNVVYFILDIRYR